MGQLAGDKTTLNVAECHERPAMTAVLRSIPAPACAHVASSLLLEAMSFSGRREPGQQLSSSCNFPRYQRASECLRTCNTQGTFAS